MNVSSLQRSGPPLGDIATFVWHRESAALKNKALTGLDGEEVIADDIFCYGRGESMEEALADHDCNLENLLKRVRSVILKFNKNKLRLNLDQVTYVGQLFTSEGLKPDPMKGEGIASMPRLDDKRADQILLRSANYLSRFMPQCLNSYAS